MKQTVLLVSYYYYLPQLPAETRRSIDSLFSYWNFFFAARIQFTHLKNTTTKLDGRKEKEIWLNKFGCFFNLLTSRLFLKTRRSFLMSWTSHFGRSSRRRRWVKAKKEFEFSEEEDLLLPFRFSQSQRSLSSLERKKDPRKECLSIYS